MASPFIAGDPMATLGRNFFAGAGAVGIPSGILLALLERKMKNDGQGIVAAEQPANLPMIERPEVVQKTRVKKLPMPEEPAEKAAVVGPAIVGGVTGIASRALVKNKEEGQGSGLLPGLAGGFAGGLLAGIPGGMVGGGILAYLLTKAKSKQQVPAAQAPAEKAAFDPMGSLGKTTLGQIGGVVGGAGLSYSILNKLFQRRDERKFEIMLKQREDRLNDLLLQEQSMAAGLPKAAMSLVTRASESAMFTEALEKLAENLYDSIEKIGGDIPLSQLFEHAKSLLGMTEGGVLGMAAPAALAAGTAYGFDYTRSRDPNVLKAKAVRDSLKERLTGKDQLVGPMPIRVESDQPEMRPIRPGASSLVDPTRGRDVLEGI